MTTSPSWLPTWPSTFPDLGAIARRVMPAQFPEGLYDAEADTDESKDVRSVADVFNLVQQTAHWIRACIAPQNDSNGLFLSLWETCLGVGKGATVAIRSAIITSAWRIRWTMTKASTQAVFAEHYGVAPAFVNFTVPTYAQILAAVAGSTDAAYRKIFQMTLDGGGVPPLSWSAAEMEARKRAPAWEQWVIAEESQGEWDSRASTWDHTTWA
jgi:hypothetical protein